VIVSAACRLISVSALWLVGLNAMALPIVSGDGTESCSSYLDATCHVMTIDRHPAWATGSSSADWISFADTGYDGKQFQVPSSAAMAAASFFETVTFSSLTELALRVWGDDTVQIFLNDVAQNLPDFSQDGACAGGAIGCQPNEFGDFFWALGAGTYTLRFDVYQVGGGPFGLLYTGTANPASVPEPGSLALLVGGLLGLVVLRRRAVTPAS
jgi:hypothetical protein